MEAPVKHITIEIFASPGCRKCAQTKKVLRELIEEVGGDNIEWREVSVLEELDYAVLLGVLATPAIAVNGELVFTSLPSARKFKAELLRRVAAGR